MCDLTANPIFYVLIVNILALIWAVRSWKKGIREKWMNALRDSGAEVIGAAELIYGIEGIQCPESPAAKSDFIAKEQKLLLLFAHSEEEKQLFQERSEKLRGAAESQAVTQYRSEVESFSDLIGKRVLREWKAIK